MTKKQALFHCAVFVAAFILSFSWYMSHDAAKSTRHPWSYRFITKKTIRTWPSSLGRMEGVASRDLYELMKYRDPATGRIPPGIRDRELRYARTLPTKRPSLRKGTDVEEVQASWSLRGPINVGGRTRALAYDVANPSTIIAGGVSGGIWRTTNSGTSWDRRGPGTDVQSTTCLVQDVRTGRTATWYYGTGELRGNSASGPSQIPLYRGDGIFKSVDNGLSWSKLGSTSTQNVEFDQTFDYVWNIALSATDLVRDMVVAACIGTIQVSTNGGTSWSTALGTIVNDAGPRYTDVLSTSQGVFYATLSSKNMVSSNITATGRGLWRSVDGLQWVNITPLGWPSEYNRVVVGAAPSNENIVYFLGEAPGSVPTGHVLWKYQYLSGDGSGSGGSWTDLSANLPNESGLDGNAVFNSQVSYDLDVAVYPLDPNIVYIGAINLYRSLDGGATPGTWSRIGGYASPNTYARFSTNHPDHHALVFHPTLATVMLNGNDGGVFRLTNALGATWNSLNNGYFTTQFYTIAVDKGTVGDQTVMGGMQDNGTWYTADSEYETPWSEVATGDGSFCFIEPGGANAYVSFQEGVVYRTAAAGSGRIDPAGATGQLFINPYVLDEFDPRRVYYAGGSTVWRAGNVTAIPLGSNDPASTGWENMAQTSLTSFPITALATSKNVQGILYYGTANGLLFKMTNAHQGKPSPQDLHTGSGFPANAYVSCIAVDPVNAQHVLVSFSNYGVQSVFATTDGGDNWTDVSGNLEEIPSGTGDGPSVRWVGILPDSSAYYYFAATSTGLVSTRVLAGTATVWTSEGAGTIGNAVVDMLDIRTSDGYVAVGTHGNGVFSATIPVVPPPPPVPPAPVPTEFVLTSPYPNPFNAGTTVEFSIPAPARTTVKVYDLGGRLLKVLADGVFPAGLRPVHWDARSDDGAYASSGVYLIAAESSGRVLVHKAVLIR